MVISRIQTFAEVLRTRKKAPVIPRLARTALRRSFPLWERLGVHVTPVHFYQPVPDSRSLDPALWDRFSALAGIDQRLSDQLAFLQELTALREEYVQLGSSASEAATGFALNNQSFGSVDAELLYAIIRRMNPRRVIEVGSGNSTLLIQHALEQGEPDFDHLVIDPYPSKTVVDRAVGQTRLALKAVQDIDIDAFSALRENDILFIDSSHVLRTGSDVQFLYLEVLPRLNPGVLIHLHDIFLPAEYPRDWVMRKRYFWSEQYLLQAFLAFNSSFRIEIAAHLIHRCQPDALAHAFPSYDRESTRPGSFWIRRIA